MQVNDFKSWTNVENDWSGHYRLVVATKVAYEIFVEYYIKTNDDEDYIRTAKASLCVTGLWRTNEGNTELKREWIGKHLPIQELLEIAQNDYDENMK